MKNKKELAASRNEYLKAKKEKKKAKWAEIEKEVGLENYFIRNSFKFIVLQGEKEKGKWQNFSKKAFGKKGFVKKSIFKTPEEAAGKVRNHSLNDRANLLSSLWELFSHNCDFYHYFVTYMYFQVGVGTMGIGGKEMTEFSTVPKYRKGQ